MPYIPPQNRPGIDEAVMTLAEEIADKLEKENVTAAISEYYRRTFIHIADFIRKLEEEGSTEPSSNSQKVAKALFDAALSYKQQGGWLGELNYAITRLIQAVPYTMYKRGVWKEALRYWLYASTVGALTGTANELFDTNGNDWITNGLGGVFLDIKDEYKRRVNTSYECLQIRKSGDCYEMSPFKTELVEFEHAGKKGWIEIMLEQKNPE